MQYAEDTTDSFDDLVLAAQGNWDFWDNPWDDEDWNEPEQICVNLCPPDDRRLSL